MQVLTTKIVFRLDDRLAEVATIEKNGHDQWFFHTDHGYSTKAIAEYKSFDKAYAALKGYERNRLTNLVFDRH